MIKFAFIFQDNLKREKQDLAAMRRNCRATKRRNRELESESETQAKQIEAQMFVMNNLRNGIDYLKEHCSKADASGEGNMINSGRCSSNSNNCSSSSNSCSNNNNISSCGSNNNVSNSNNTSSSGSNMQFFLQYPERSLFLRNLSPLSYS